MPHIAITMLPGRTPEQKKSLARKLREVLSEELNVDNLLVSVSVSDLPIEGWGGGISRTTPPGIDNNTRREKRKSGFQPLQVQLLTRTQLQT